MKKLRPALLLLLVLTTVALPAGPASAAELTRAQFRKFLGRYEGAVSGIAGNATLGTKPVGPFATRFTVTTRRSELLPPMISDLYTAVRHRIVWAAPTGTPRRAVLVGLYRGTFLNQAGVPIQVAGSRRLVLRDRGASFSKRRYVSGLTDTLAENFAATGRTSAAQNLRGSFRK